MSWGGRDTTWGRRLPGCGAGENVSVMRDAGGPGGGFIGGEDLKVRNTVKGLAVVQDGQVNDKKRHERKHEVGWPLACEMVRRRDKRSAGDGTKRKEGRGRDNTCILQALPWPR